MEKVEAATLKRMCIKDWSITAQNGDHFEIKKGEVYATAAHAKEGKIMVFGNFWVPVPADCLTTEGATLGDDTK